MVLNIYYRKCRNNCSDIKSKPSVSCVAETFTATGKLANQLAKACPVP